MYYKKMLYLRNITTTQVLQVPKSVQPQQSAMALRLFSTIDRRQLSSIAVTDAGTSPLYHIISVALPSGIPNGEYEYDLAIGSTILSTGLLTIGDYANSDTQYQYTTQYEQYND